ncbi:MAG: hypothetical protein IT368_16070 [Candidatus Hydrogenedentes bacterium]|nr:hypothetical protein [Candidatus Hydrogenedentota bacterium]
MKRLIAVFLLIATPGAFSDEPYQMGTRRELFVDSFLIAEMTGARLELHEPREEAAVLQFDKPWEGRYCGYVTMLQDEQGYRMYYRGLPEAGQDGSNNEVTCVALSAAGGHWTRPDLGLFKVRGADTNNVVLADTAPFSHNFSPFRDSRTGVPEAERYKAIAGTSGTGLVPFVSADGFAWKKLQDEAVITAGAFDSQNVAFWSEAEQHYICYFRTWSEGEFAGFRSVSRSTSPDFRTWSPPVEMNFGGTPREHLYTNQTWPYYRAPHLYIAVAARFMPGRTVITQEEANALGIEGGYWKDISDAVFMTSRGGNEYDRTFMQGFIRPGIGHQNWTSRTNYPAWGMIETVPGELSLFVQHNYGQPTANLTRYTLRTDGFASIRAPYEGGEVTTKPFLFAGSRLHLNFQTSAAGGILVELQHADGSAIDGFSRDECREIIGNELDRVVDWGGTADVSALAGTPVRLRFIMKDADLYAIQFE